jgi:two-component system alkaline phosphatase synthesis response regulator PhoP
MRNQVLLVQNDKKLRTLISQKLTKNFFTVHEHSRGAGTREKIKQCSPNLIIIDINLPDIKGLALCKQITRFYPNIPIIILTKSNDFAHLTKYFKLGINDYISKPLDIKELIARVKARIHKVTSTEKKLHVGNIVIKDTKKEVLQNNKKLDLTPREYDLLKFLIINKNRVVNRETILKNVWQKKTYINPRNVDIYIGYLRKKLNSSESANQEKDQKSKTQDKKMSDNRKQNQYIKTVRGFGYKITDDTTN